MQSLYANEVEDIDRQTIRQLLNLVIHIIIIISIYQCVIEKDINIRMYA
jgi:hypothetical protein